MRFERKFLFYSLLITLGFFQLPTSLPEVDSPRSAPWAYLLYWGLSCAPLVPLFLAQICAVTGWRFPNAVASSGAFLIGLVGTSLGSALAVFSGAGSNLALIYNLSITTAIVASVLLLSQKRKGRELETYAWKVFMLPVVVSIWSVTMVGVTSVKAILLSGGNPYCIAAHGIDSDVSTFAQLRALSFHTTKTGYKLNSEWYFHGLLIIETHEEQEVFNWSPRRMDFFRLDHPESFFVNPSDSCTPRKGFLGRLTLI